MEYLLVNKKPNAVWVTEKDISSEWISSEYYDPKFLEIEKNFLSNKFDIYKFDEIADINRVSGFEVEKYLEIVTKGVPYLRVKNIEECFVEHDDLYHIPQYVHQKFKKSQFKKNDIAMTITGRVGTAALINDETTEYNASQDVVKISLKKGRIDPYYLTIYLNSRINHSLLSRFNSGGSRQRTLINNVREVSIPIPSPEIQKYIGDKVRKAEELREEAKKLKSEAEKILTEELDLNALNLSMTQNNDKHIWIKKGNLAERIDATSYSAKIEQIRLFFSKYKIVKLKDIVEFKKGFAFKSKDYLNKGTILLLRVTDIETEGINYDSMIKLSNETYYSNKSFELENNDIVMVVTGNTTGKSVIINNKQGTILLNQNAIRMRVRNLDIDPYYIELVLKSDYFQKLLNYALFQSVQPFISMEFLNKIDIPIIEFNKVKEIASIYRKCLDNLFISKQLIREAKKDVEDLIEGNFDMAKLNQS